jgi:hypothetical protein
LEKGHGRVNIVQILCTYVCKWKNDTCWNYSRNEGGAIKENDRWGRFKYDIFDILQEHFKCHNISHSAQFKKIVKVIKKCRWSILSWFFYKAKVRGQVSIVCI